MNKMLRTAVVGAVLPISASGVFGPVLRGQSTVNPQVAAVSEQPKLKESEKDTGTYIGVAIIFAVAMSMGYANRKRSANLKYYVEPMPEDEQARTRRKENKHNSAPPQT